MVAIVDYGMGNLRSVANAIDYLGFEFALISKPEELSGYEKMILPGVGSFHACMSNLKKEGMDQAIHEFVKSGKYFLGICLGMQVLATKGNEPFSTDGLNLIPGEVKLFELEKQFPVPHVGWNNVSVQKNNHWLFEGIKNNSDFYFTHSYYFETTTEYTLTTTSYGKDFTSAVIKDNVMATQFHPEKSQDNGTRMLLNFLSHEG